MSDEAERLRWALGFAKLAPVLPLHSIHEGLCSCGSAKCPSPGKHPLTPHGAEDASTDEFVIRGWFARWPRANIGMTLAEFVVLDVDPRNGGDESLQRLLDALGGLPETYTVLTGGGGEHYYFRARDDVELRVKAIAGYPGLDIKHGRNSYVLVPGSTHVSGGRYAKEVSSSLQIAPLPDSLFKLLIRPNGEAGKRFEVPPQIPHGTRRNTMLSAAGLLRDRGASKDELLALLHAMNKRCVTADRIRPDPLRDDEIEQVTNDVVLRYEPTRDFDGKRRSDEQRHQKPESQKLKARMKLVSLEDVKIERTEWIEIGYIPAQNFTLFEGRGGIGKTTMAMAFLAAWSNSKRLLPVDPEVAIHYPFGGPKNVLAIVKEDNHGELKARLRQYAASEKCVTLIDGLDYVNEETGEVEEHDGIVYLPRDLDALQEAIDATRASVVYIDALHSHVVSDDPKDPVAVRKAYQPLIDLCRRKNVSIVAVRHPGKGGGKHAHDQGLGSSEIIHVVRSVLLFDQHPNDGALRVIAPVKWNLWEEMPAVTYRIEKVDSVDDNGQYFTVSKIEIVGTDGTIKANDLSMATPDGAKTRTQTEACIDVILGLFENVETVRASDMKDACSDFSERTLERARSLLTSKHAPVLKRSRVGKFGEAGAYVIYVIDRALAAMFAKKSACSPTSTDGAQREDAANIAETTLPVARMEDVYGEPLDDDGTVPFEAFDCVAEVREANRFRR